MINNKTLIACGLIIAIAIGIVAVFFASGDPDGLESTALVVQGQKTITGSSLPDAEVHENMEDKFTYTPPMPDYSVGEKSGSGGSVLAIIGGTILAFAIAIGLIYVIKAATKKTPPKVNQ